MSDIADRINQKIKDRSDASLDSFEVDAWGETIYFKPMTAGDVSRLQRRHPHFLDNADMDAMLDLIILKSCDEEGEKIFDIKSKMSLKNEDVKVIASIATAIMSTRSQDDIEGN